jgi:15-cis-phytoene synthase
MIEKFDRISIACSKKTTRVYSTSFSLGIRFLSARFRDPVYSIYGFVRLADEIVDSFHDFDKAVLLDRFRADTYKAIEEKISLNPILHAFQKVYHQYQFSIDLVDTFLDSMAMDLAKTEYSRVGYEEYILGSAEVVGLMCLKVFTENNCALYDKLKPQAMKLGSAFQKINFLRDIKADYETLGRSYFPEIDIARLDNETKRKIEDEIAADFEEGYQGILQLPKDARFGVYVAYTYYFRLFKKIKAIPCHRIMEERVRIPNRRKFTLLLRSYLKHSFNSL